MNKKAFLLFLFPFFLFCNLKENEKNYFLSASYTYWSCYQDAMEVGYTSGTSSQVGNAIYPNFYATSGFKVSTGTATNHDNWNGFFRYTWFSNDPKIKQNSVTASAPYTSPYSDGTYFGFYTRFANQFNRFDGYLTKSFTIEKHLQFHPWAGLCVALEYQYLDINMNQSIHRNEVRGKQDWWGIGPYGGGSLVFNLNQKWLLISKIGAALLLCNHKVRYTNEEFDNDGESTGLEQNNYDVFNSVEPAIEIFVGLARSSVWECFILNLNIGWEAQTYFSHNGIRGTYPSMEKRGNYSMQGLTATAEIHF